jgi:formamidopyrimidine-DNA glycosylase
MPELPEVETVVRELRDDVVGRAFIGVSIDWAGEIHTLSPVDFTNRLINQRVTALRRRGKYIIFELTDDAMLIHLKMSGRLYVADPGMVVKDDRWTRVTFNMDDGRELRFSDARKFGRVYLVSNAEEIVGKLGPEPLEDEFTPDIFRQRLSSRTGTLKPLLLNQEFVAGVGNIYADEALWRASIDPRRKVDTLTPDEIELLYQAIRDSLQAGIDHQGTTFSWYRKPDGTIGDYQNHFLVYDRENEPCQNCGTPISKIWLAQRGTHFCSKCQK